MKYLIILLAFVFLLSFASAIDGLDTVAINDCVSLYQYCSNCTYTNLTAIKYPSQNIVSYNTNMTKVGTNYYYQFCDTSLIGNYFYTVCGNKDGVLQCEDIPFKVNPFGIDNLLGFYVVFLVIITLIFILGYGFENKWIMTLGSILVLIFGFFIIKFGIDGIKDVQTTWAIGIIVWAIGIYSLYLSVEEQLKEWN